MDKNKTKNLILSALFLGVGIVLPMLFGQIPQIGTMLLPMHIPVFLCAFICGPQYGAAVAVVLPLLRSFLFLRPNFYPEAISIAFEMAVYAIVAGLLFKYFKGKRIYLCLLAAMILGRVIRCLVQMLLLGISGAAFSFSGFFSAVIISGIPGIILQLILIPSVMMITRKKE